MHGDISLFSAIDFCLVVHFVDAELKRMQLTEQSLTRKLRNFGIYNSLKPCDPNSVIFNFSSTILAHRVKVLLAYGLDFCISVYKLHLYRYFLYMFCETCFTTEKHWLNT